MRKAFSLLEVVLAIVIIGFCIAAIPNIINVSQKGNETMLLSEAISSSKSKLLDILSYPWNSGMWESDGAILKTENNRVFAKDYTNRAFDLKSSAKPIINSSDKSGINDFDDNIDSIKISGNASIEKNILSIDSNTSVKWFNIDYVDGKTIDIDFDYENTNPSSTDGLVVENIISVPSIKQSDNEDQKIVMRAFSFNIGSVSQEE